MKRYVLLQSGMIIDTSVTSEVNEPIKKESDNIKELLEPKDLVITRKRLGLRIIHAHYVITGNGKDFARVGTVLDIPHKAIHTIYKFIPAKKEHVLVWADEKGDN